ncbi:unnamed protein product, partial [marine sediment metagenome]
SNSGSIINQGFEGFTIPIQDALSFETYLEALHQDKLLLKFMRKNCLKAIKKFSIQNYSKLVAKYIKEAFDYEILG